MSVRTVVCSCDGCGYRWYAAVDGGAPEVCPVCGVAAVRQAGPPSRSAAAHRPRHGRPPRAGLSMLRSSWPWVAAVLCTAIAIGGAFGGAQEGAAGDPATEPDPAGIAIFVFLSAVFWAVALRRWWMSRRRDAHPDGGGQNVVDGGFDPRVIDGWSERYFAAHRKVEQFRRVARTASAPAVRDWLDDLAGQLGGQLEPVARLCALGRSLTPDPAVAPPGPAAQVIERLDEFDAALDSAVATAVEVRLSALDPDTDFARIRTQLGVLAEQLPNLR